MEKSINIITAFFLTVFIISVSVVATLNFRSLYYFDIKFLKIEEKSRMSEKEIKENYDAVIDYMNIFNPSELTLPELNVSENGRIHFEEVKNIFSAFIYAGAVTFILSALLIYRNIKNKSIRFLKYTGIFSFLSVVLSVVFVLFFGDYAFTAFHKIFFRNDFWIFDERTDPIIKILPEAFFFHCGFMIIFLILVLSIISILIYKKLKRGNL